MIRAAIVGLGRWGRSLVTSVQGKSKDLRFVLAHTRTRATAEDFCRSQELALVDSYEQLLADRNVDAVVLTGDCTDDGDGWELIDAAFSRWRVAGRIDPREVARVTCPLCGGQLQVGSLVVERSFWATHLWRPLLFGFVFRRRILESVAKICAFVPDDGGEPEIVDWPAACVAYRCQGCTSVVIPGRSKRDES